MSKKKKKDKHKDNDYYQYGNIHPGYNSNMYPPNFNQGYNGGYPPNIQNGQNFNNASQPQNQTDLNTLLNLLGNIDSNQLINMLSQMNNTQQNSSNNGLPNMDQAYNLLNSLKPFMPPERITMLENTLKSLNSNKK